jgi:hypothetical protein
MKVKQLSLFLENEPGSLRRPVDLLASAKLNILSLQVADTAHFGILRLIVKDWEKAKQLLDKAKFVVKVTDMVAIEVGDAPGGLSKILAALSSTHVNLEYMYGFTEKRQGKGVLLFRFDDPDRAIEALRQKKINPLSEVELFD